MHNISPILPESMISTPKLSHDSQMLPQTMTFSSGSQQGDKFLISWCAPYKLGLIKWLKPVSVPQKTLVLVVFLAVILQSRTPALATMKRPGSIQIYKFLLWRSLIFLISSKNSWISMSYSVGRYLTPNPPPMLICLTSGNRLEIQNIYLLVSMKTFLSDFLRFEPMC